MQATEHKHKHKASDKTCFKHISNQKSWMQTTWFWWLIKLKRILCVNPGQFLHTSGQSCFKHILLVNPSHFWSIPHTSGQSLLVDPAHVTPAISGQSFTLLINLSHFCQWCLVNLTKHVSNTSQTKRAECKRADFHDLSNWKEFCYLVISVDQTEKNSLI